MLNRPDVLVAWQAVCASTTLNTTGEEYTLADFVPAAHARDSIEDRHECLFSLIVSDVDDDRSLEQTLASLLENDLSATQVVVVGHRRREAALIRTLDQASISRSIELHIVDGDTDAAASEASALKSARGEFVGFVVAGDCLDPRALALLRQVTLDGQAINIIYTDEAWLDSGGMPRRLRLKSGWDPDAHLGRDHFGQLCLLRRDRVSEVGGIRLEHAPAHHYDLTLRVALSVLPSTIWHVPAVLCRRAIPGEDTNGAGVETYLRAMREAARLAAELLCGEPVTVTPAPLATFANRIHWPVPAQPPLVSVLIPTRDHADLLKNCVEGLLKRTSYDNFEALILDNDSTEPATLQLLAELSRDPRVRVVPAPGPFNFSQINNDGVHRSRGDILLFMNNDIEIIEGQWLDEMVSHALRPDVGCVGARLLYRDRHIQHAGVVLQPGPLAMHVFRQRHESELGFDAQLAGPRRYSAVTAACLAVRRPIFDRAGGFDATDFQVSFQDVDLCLKIEEMGYRNICTPFEPLFHLEGASRSTAMTLEKVALERREFTHLIHRWKDRFYDDRFGHPCIRLDWERPERLVPLPHGVAILDLVR